jgi:hypothetical protein
MYNWAKKTQAIPGANILSTQTQSGRVFNAKKEPRQIIFAEHPWKLYQEPEDIPGLRVSMLPGVLTRTAAASLYPLNTLVNYTPANAPDDATTLYWLKVSVSKSAYQTFYEVWTVDTFEVETGSTLPTDTLDIPGDTAGDLYFKIGEVTTVDGEVTEIQQDLAAPVTVVFPLGLILDEFECPDDEEEE